MEITYQGLRIQLPLEGVIGVESFSMDASFNKYERSRKLFKPEFPLFFHVLLFCFPPYPGKHFC